MQARQRLNQHLLFDFIVGPLSRVKQTLANFLWMIVFDHLITSSVRYAKSNGRGSIDCAFVQRRKSNENRNTSFLAVVMLTSLYLEAQQPTTLY